MVNNMEFSHIPVLLNETLEALDYVIQNNNEKEPTTPTEYSQIQHLQLSKLQFLEAPKC